MKKYVFLLATSILFSLNLSAQFSGVWQGTVEKNGKDVDFTLKLQKNGIFSMAYDLNPNDLSVKGRWTTKGDLLNFKTSSGSIQLKKSTSRNPANGFIFTFKKGNKFITYNVHGLPKTTQLKRVSAVFGWDEGVAAVVINHEEQY